MPRFDGPHYVPERDDVRLTGQIERVFLLMRDRKWRTLEQIASETGDPHASISAQLRHLRKRRFGGYTVRVNNLGGGLFEYQLDDPAPEEPAEEPDLSTLDGRVLLALNELRNAQTRTQRQQVLVRALLREHDYPRPPDPE